MERPKIWHSVARARKPVGSLLEYSQAPRGVQKRSLLLQTYLLLIRSTDDKDLIALAHEAAKAIGDETKKAQALLDIIKEIDFLSNPNQQQ